MNKKIIFHIALLGIFSNIGAANYFRDILGKPKIYPCTVKKGTEDASPSSLRIIGLQKDPGYYSQCVREFEYNENRATIGMNAASGTRIDSFKIDGEAVQDLMKKLVESEHIIIEVMRGREWKQLHFIGNPCKALQEGGSKYYTEHLCAGLKANNENIQNVMVETIENSRKQISLLQGSWFSNSLNVFMASDLQFAREEAKRAVEGILGAYSNFIIDAASAECLANILKLAPACHRFITFDITRKKSQIGGLNEIKLDIASAREQVESQLTYVKRIKYLGSTCLAVLVLFGCFRFWSK